MGICSSKARLLPQVYHTPFAGSVLPIPLNVLLLAAGVSVFVPPLASRRTIGKEQKYGAGRKSRRHAAGRAWGACLCASSMTRGCIEGVVGCVPPGRALQAVALYVLLYTTLQCMYTPLLHHEI